MVEVYGNTFTRLYYSLDWQVVEEQFTVGSCCGTAQTRSQYVWGLGFVDHLVLRDDNADGSGTTGNYGKTGSGLERRRYA